MKRPAPSRGLAAAVLRALFRSPPLQVLATSIIYAFYGCLIGVALLPSALLELRAYHTLFDGPSAPLSIGRLLLFCMTLGCSVFLFVFSALALIGSVVRLLSQAVKPGRHELASRTAFFWMALNGLHTVAFRALLPIVPATFFTRTYFRLAGCRMGRNVWLTTCVILDPYMISIGDDTFIGGDTVISAHQFENGRLSVGPIRIGARCDTGADVLINLGVMGDSSDPIQPSEYL